MAGFAGDYSEKEGQWFGRFHGEFGRFAGDYSGKEGCHLLPFEPSQVSLRGTIVGRKGNKTKQEARRYDLRFAGDYSEKEGKLRKGLIRACRPEFAGDYSEKEGFGKLGGIDDNDDLFAGDYSEKEGREG